MAIIKRVLVAILKILTFIQNINKTEQTHYDGLPS